MTLDQLTQALAASGPPEAAITAIDAASAALIGHCLFTVLVVDEARGVRRRFHSSRPAEYPVGGFKPIPAESEYFRTIVTAGEPRFCHDRDDIIRTFDDHALILSLGCESAVNMPIRWNGRTLGAMNLLNAARHYNQTHLPILRLLAALSVAPLLCILEAGD